MRNTSDTAAQSGMRRLLTRPGRKGAAKSYVGFTTSEQKSWYKQSALKLSNSTVATNRKMSQRFVRWLSAQNYAVSTQERYFRIAKSLCQYIGQMPLSAVTPMDIGDYLTRNLPHRWSDDFVADQLCALRCFFDFLYLGGVVDRVAPRFLKARARVMKLPRTLTQAQIKKLIRAAENPRDRALLELLYATGCRVGEIRGIRVEDIDFRARMFRVRGKRKERVVYFGKPSTKALRLYLAGRKGGYVFQDIIHQQKGYITYYKKAWIGNWRDHRPGKARGTKHSKWLGNPSTISYATAQRKFRTFLKGVDLVRHKPDRPLTRSTLGHIVREIGRRAGLGAVSPHMLRHSFATHLLERGADIRAIQELLGHSYLSSTQIYTRISNNSVRATFRHFHPRGD
jgi:site-specific recombinase XerD